MGSNLPEGRDWPFSSQMSVAIAEARQAGSRGEIPVGAAVARADGRLIASAGNMTRELNDPTAHAEVVAIRMACEAVASSRLTGCSIYVTLEPCAMCAGAISHARIRRLFYGAADPKSGGVENGARVFEHPQCHFVPEVYSGICETESAELLRKFFAGLRIGRSALPVGDEERR